MNRSVTRNPFSDWLIRIVLAILLALGICAFVGATAWSGESVRPYSDSELRSVRTAEDVKVEDLRQQEVTQLRIALGRRLPTHRRADLYLRLAEIYLEAYRATFLLEGRVHDKRLERGQKDPTIDRSHSKPYLSLGIKAAHDILSLRIPFERVDQVEYLIGYNNEELGNQREALRHFEILTRKYPGSPYCAEALGELGDAAFGDNQFRKAQSYYEQAVQKNPGPSLPRILHRLAWSYYRTRQYDRAVATMKDAIAKTEADNEKYVSLKEEALRDMAVFMTEAGRVDEAIAYFKSVAGDKDYYARALEKLGKQYERNVEPQKAIQVYEAILKTHPEDEAAFRVRTKLVDLDLRRGRLSDALSRVKGVTIPSSGENDTMTAVQNMKAMIRRTATENHENYRKKGNKESLQVAESFYSAYLDLFLSGSDANKERAEIEMYLADVKRELGKADESAALYRKVIDSRDDRYAKEAAALWTASLADAIRKAPKRSDANEPSALEREFVDAADELQSSLGETNEGREAAVKAAQVLAGYKKTQSDAIKRSKRIIENAPKSSQALIAARLWVQLLADRLPSISSGKIENSDEASDLEDAMKSLRENSVLMATDREMGQGKLFAMMADQENKIRIGSIASREKQNDFGSAAQGYESYAKDASQKDIAEKAYANAIDAYVKAEDGASVHRVAESWLKRFPASKGAVDSLRAAATHFLIRGNFTASTDEFEQCGILGHDPDSLETAIRLAEGNGDLARAVSLTEAFIKNFPKSDHVQALLLGKGKNEDALGHDSDAAKSYGACFVDNGETGPDCGARLADLYLRAKDMSQAKAILNKLAAFKRKGSSPSIGYARFRLGEILETEARFLPLQLPEAQLKKALSQRLDFLEPLSRAYTNVVDAGGIWAIAALDRLARFAAQFADDVDRLEPSAKTDPKAVEQFRRNLKTVSEPLRRKAQQTWQDAYERAVKAELLSPALPGIAENVGFYAQGFHGRFRLAGVPADGGDGGADKALASVRTKLFARPQDSGAWVDYGNLLWGMGKPLLAKIAYDRALSLDRKNAAALNNRAVVTISGSQEEDGAAASDGALYLKEALKADPFFLAAKMNRAILLGYYRVFPPTRTLWQQVLAKAAAADAYDGLAISEFAAGNYKGAEAAFQKANASGADSSRFSFAYHQAAKAALSGVRGSEQCLSNLKDLAEDKLTGFEKESVTRLRGKCTLWKDHKAL